MAFVNYGILALNLITGVYTARVMGPSNKGVYYAVTSWTGIAGTLALFGFSQALGWYYRQTSSPKALYKMMVRLTTFSSIVLAVALAVPIASVIAHVSSHAIWVAILGLAILPLGSAGSVAWMLLTLEGEYGAYNFIRIAQTITFTILVVFFGIINHLTANALILLAYATNVFPSLLFLFKARKILSHRRDQHGSLPGVVRIIRKSAQYFVPTLASTFNTRLDQMLNTIWLAASGIGLYGVALASLNVAMVAMGAFSTVFFSMFVGKDRDKIFERTTRSARLLLIVSAVMTIVILVISPVALPLLYGHRYDRAYSIIVSLVLSVPFMTMIGVLYQGFNALGRPLLSLPSESVGAVSGAILLAVLTPRLGAVGAGASDTISYGLDVVVALWQWNRIGGDVKNLVPRAQDISDLGTFGRSYAVKAIRAISVGSRVH